MAKTLFFTYSSYYGGDDTVLLELLRAWEGERPTVVLNADHPARSFYEKETRVAPVALSTLPRPLAFLADLLSFGRVLGEAQAVLVSTGGFPLAPATFRFLLSAAARKRVVLAVHNYPNAPTLYRRAAGALATLLCDQVVSVSRDCARALQAFNLRADRPVRVVLNGVPAADGAAAREELGMPPGPLVGAIGNLEERKGFTVLAQAMERLQGARCVIIGAPTADGTAEKLRGVTLAGYKPQAWRYVACFDVCAIPSLYNESFGLLALDAMRFGKPVVATRVGGLPEVVEDGRTGLLVPPGDPAALAEALSSLLNDPKRARELGEAGRRRWQELFTSGRMAREYHAVLQSA